MKTVIRLLYAALLAQSACGGRVNAIENSNPVPPNEFAPDAQQATPSVDGDAAPLGSPEATSDASMTEMTESDAGPLPTSPIVVQNPDGTIAFTPSTVDATRFSMGCGVANPPFRDGDLFSMNVIGNNALAPYNALDITFNSPASVGTPLSLAVQPFSLQGTGIGMPDGGFTWYAGQNAQGRGVNFTYSQGSDPSEIDTGAFDSVTVTIVAMPAKDGDQLTLRIQIHFVDGKTLDDTFSGNLTTSWGGCGAG